MIQGHRRTFAGQDLLANPEKITVIFNMMADSMSKDSPTKAAEIKRTIVERTNEVIDNLNKVQVMVYKDLTTEERLVLKHDQGSMKGLSKTGVARMVWELDKQFFRELDIIRIGFTQLAGFNGNTRKLAEMPKEPIAREKFLRKWLHGTLGNWLLPANRMGPYVREQTILYLRSLDGLLKEGEVVECKLPRTRIEELTAAKKEEEAVWTSEKGSPKFNALLQKFRDEDKGVITKEKVERPSAKDLKERVDMFLDANTKDILRFASGEKIDLQKLDERDKQSYRDSKAFECLAAIRHKLPNGFGEFAKHLLGDNIEELETYLKSLVPTEMT